MSTVDFRAVVDVVRSRPRFLQPWETKPDLHLIKQVEQVTMLVARTARRFARIRSMEIRGQ
jgi:hypothetical protein